jgi:hypothetical protein
MLMSTYVACTTYPTVFLRRCDSREYQNVEIPIPALRSEVRIDLPMFCLKENGQKQRVSVLGGCKTILGFVPAGIGGPAVLVTVLSGELFCPLRYYRLVQLSYGTTSTDTLVPGVPEQRSFFPVKSL